MKKQNVWCGSLPFGDKAELVEQAILRHPPLAIIADPAMPSSCTPCSGTAPSSGLCKSAREVCPAGTVGLNERPKRSTARRRVSVIAPTWLLERGAPIAQNCKTGQTRLWQSCPSAWNWIGANFFTPHGRLRPVPSISLPH
jgi:hypothetical protein